MKRDDLNLFLSTWFQLDYDIEILEGEEFEAISKTCIREIKTRLGLLDCKWTTQNLLTKSFSMLWEAGWKVGLLYIFQAEYIVTFLGYKINSIWGKKVHTARYNEEKEKACKVRGLYKNL